MVSIVSNITKIIVLPGPANNPPVIPVIIPPVKVN